MLASTILYNMGILKEYDKNDEIKEVKTYKNEIIERSKKLLVK
jgi:hypothetical protein